MGIRNGIIRNQSLRSIDTWTIWRPVGNSFWQWWTNQSQGTENQTGDGLHREEAKRAYNERPGSGHELWLVQLPTSITEDPRPTHLSLQHPPAWWLFILRLVTLCHSMATEALGTFEHRKQRSGRWQGRLGLSLDERAIFSTRIPPYQNASPYWPEMGALTTSSCKEGWQECIWHFQPYL